MRLPRCLSPFVSRSQMRALAVVLGLLGCATALGCGEDQVAQQPRNADLIRGHQLYVTHCLACHRAQGEGLGEVMPPLALNATVSGPKDRLIRIVLHGLAGPMKAGGRSYDGVMHGLSRLSDAEVALLLTYIRQKWGNQAEQINAEEVAEVRKAHAQRIQPWTVEELNQLGTE